MTAQIIDGKAIAASLRKDIKARVEALAQQGKRPPGLAVILVGADPASQVYVGSKRRACDELGFKSVSHALPADTTSVRSFCIAVLISNALVYFLFLFGN